MSDLISRSELLEEIKSLSIVLNGKQIFSDDAKDTVLRIISEQPTAYDIGKVVEELEERKHEICLSDDDLEYYQNGIDDAIEIVKHGDVSGASEDICEWELKNACYTTSIKHYYSLPTSIVKTFNNCPYCGKKIKVVE